MSKIDSKYTIAIIMPVRNEEKFLGQTLDQVYLQDFPMDKVEVVIADGFSTDKTREIAESFKGRFGSLKVLDNPGRLPSSGRNVGVKNSTAPYILILDGHTYIPSKNFLSDIIAKFKETGAQCLCRPQPLLPPDINEFEKSVALCRGSSLGHKPGSEIYAEFEGIVDPTSSGAMYTREVFEKIGYFDEKFDACEDVDFNYRVKLAGFQSYLSPKLTVFYYPRSSITGLWKQMNRYGMGRFKFALKHKIFSPIQWFAGAAVFGFFAALVLSFMFTPVFELFRSAIAFYLLIILAFSTYLAVDKKHIGCLIYGLLIFPTIHFGLGFGFLKVMVTYFKYKDFKELNKEW
ncbi:MAG: glycosyltransferase family 2 protein [Calditrichaeota bacterium]|nr:MAG: glycosyltransferase family 2 protein [Calditrichota bacterium]